MSKILCLRDGQTFEEMMTHDIVSSYLLQQQQQQQTQQQPRKRPIAPSFIPPLKGPSPVAHGVSRPFPGIREAPTFEPTAEEWMDPLAYIAALPPTAAAAGIIKIRPPRSWSPPCVLNPKVPFVEFRNSSFILGSCLVLLDVLVQDPLSNPGLAQWLLSLQSELP